MSLATFQSAFNQPQSQRSYPFEKTGYPNLRSLPPPPQTKAKSFAEAVDKARENCQTCQTAQPDLVPIGPAIITSGDPETFERRNVRQTRPILGDTYPAIGTGPVYIPTAGSALVRSAEGKTHTATPLWSNYNPELFQTPLDRTENKVSLGVVSNPWTGEIFEAFENEMPPPTTNKALDPSVFKRTNPRLVWLNGGIDPNAPLPTKKEVCQDIPGADGGPNVWGDQLYEAERRKRMAEIVNRDVWMNRNGDYSVEPSLNGEKPAGYVGLQPAYRAIPYMPPTQLLDNKDWRGPVESHFTNETNRDLVQSAVFTRKPDLTTCPHTGLPENIDGVEAVQVVPVVVNKPTWRGETETLYSGPASASGHNQGGYVVTDTTPRPTLKELMDQTFPQQQANSEGAGGYVVLDTHVKPTMKELMAQSFPVANAAVGGAGEYVVLDYNVRATLKELMDQSFPNGNAALPDAGGWLLLDSMPRATLKELMGQLFPALNAARESTGGWVLQDPTVRATLKELMDEQYPVTSAAVESAGGWVLQDLTPRPTLKGLMGEEFPVSAAAVQTAGGVVGFQGPLEGSKRMYYSDKTVALNISNTTGHGEYIGPGDVTSSQYRGTVATNYVIPSHTPENGGGDTSTTWIGESTRDTMREFAPYTPVADFAQQNGTHITVPRWRPQVNPSCKRPDDVDDQFLSVRPNYFWEAP